MKRILTVLCIVMAVLIVIISVTTVSFSWFEPGKKSGTGLQFSEVDIVRPSNCCKMVNYIVGETETEFSGDTETTIASGNTAYFKTVVKNNADYDTNISLYLENISLTPPADTVGDFMLAVTIPTNTCRSFQQSQTDMHIVRNACVRAYDVEVAGTGEITIEWFIKSSSGSVSFKASDIYITYN